MREKIDPKSLAERRTCFEIHIRPMMRLLDHDHMLYRAPAGQRMDLFDYDAVKQHAVAILERLQANMPTIPYGGPWPAEWILLFERWIEEDFPRLKLFEATYDVVKDAEGLFVLTATATTVRKRDRIWLERFSTSDAPREYFLYREPGTGDPNAATVKAIERFPAGSGVTTVVVHDAKGRQVLNLPV
jgi:hypothetical protein